jgi:hypothetical protein
MLPGWLLRTPAGVTPTVSYNFFPIGLGIAAIYDQAFRDFPVEGKYSLGLFPDSIIPSPPFYQPFSLSQIGDVPFEAKSIHFIEFGGEFEMRVNDTLVPLTYVYPPDYHTDAANQKVDVFANIASFAGQTVELKFTTIQRTIPPNVNGIDSISFSPQLIPTVPEPGTWALLGLGGTCLFFRWRFLRSSVRVRRE